MVEDIRFVASKNYRVLMAVTAALAAIFVGAFLWGGAGINMAGIPIGVGVAMYFTYPSYAVKQDSLFFKFGMSKWTFLYNENVFRIERLTGFKSFMQSFQAQSYVFRVTGRKKPQTVSIALSDEEFAVMVKLMRERGAVFEGDMAGLV